MKLGEQTFFFSGATLRIPAGPARRASGLARSFCPCLWLGIFLVLGPIDGSGTEASKVVVSGEASTMEAVHGRGNVYAPEIVAFGGEWLMFFGGQGADGHDRIHLATSGMGEPWEVEGVVFNPEGVNHVNDPSLVVVGGRLMMFYTRAGQGVTDAIALAISQDGRHWEDVGQVFGPSDPPAWDSLSVGRPSVWHDGERFHLWYDGRKDLPLGAPDDEAPKSAMSRRAVGYATSLDGREWERREEPVFGEDAGGVHVRAVEKGFVMVYESREGTRWAESPDGFSWVGRGLLQGRSDDLRERYGHVTPFLHLHGGTALLYYGAAAAPTWDENEIVVSRLTDPPFSW